MYVVNIVFSDISMIIIKFVLIKSLLIRWVVIKLGCGFFCVNFLCEWLDLYV